MEKEIAHIRNAVTRLPELRFKQPVEWTIREGEQWAVVGPNGAGKTLISAILQRKFAFKEGDVSFGVEGKSSEIVKSIAFKDIYSLADCRNSYYQQRWHATEADEMPTVEETLKGLPDFQEIFHYFGIEELLPKKIIYLSSGELRKFLIIRTLLYRPKILILDNPFIGLDAPSRTILVDMLQQLSHLHGVQVVLLLSNPADIPEMITHVLPVADKSCYPAMGREEFLHSILAKQLFPGQNNTEINLPVDPKKQPSRHDVTFRMEHVCIRYGERTILKDLDWEVRNGEKWALFGPNGSGKSTLLSLIYADNPQSYANTLYLFDKKRGSGESIWDIKKRIGYVSPEMHLYYMENVPTLNIVGSGYFDSVGLFQKCNDEQNAGALKWMELFGIGHLKERSFLTLSSGEQRLALLARAFVKDPDLIILDEPLHGLDASNKIRAAAIIEKFYSRPGKTLIYVTHYPHELPRCVNKRFELVKQH